MTYRVRCKRRARNEEWIGTVHGGTFEYVGDTWTRTETTRFPPQRRAWPAVSRKDRMLAAWNAFIASLDP